MPRNLTKSLVCIRPHRSVKHTDARVLQHALYHFLEAWYLLGHVSIVLVPRVCKAKAQAYQGAKVRVEAEERTDSRHQE